MFSKTDASNGISNYIGHNYVLSNEELKATTLIDLPP